MPLAVNSRQRYPCTSCKSAAGHEPAAD